MGRKLIRRVPTEQDLSLSKKLPKGHVAIIVAQHVLIYSSGYVIASTAYLVHTGTITKDLLPAAVILVFAGCASLTCIGLCNATAWRSSRPAGRSFLTSEACLETLSKNAIRFVATAWMVASGLAIVFTVARRPLCLMSARAKLHSPAIDVGTQCIVQRASVAASLLAMIASIGLFLLTWKTTDPYFAHLLGINKPPQLLPFALPYKKDHRPMFSVMSFKCRSTSTFSSYTIAEPTEDTLYTLYPTRPEKAYGLGMYAPKTSAASFLTPRPSLRTIRSQASFGHRQLKSSPVPPLSVYDPEKYKDLPIRQKISQPPRRVYTSRKKYNQRTMQAVQCDLTPTKDKPLAFDRSVSKASLSSIYSRSVSGDSPDPSRQSAVINASGRPVNNSAALTTNRRKNLNVTCQSTAYPRLDYPRLRSRLRDDHASQKVDNNINTTLRFPIMRAVSTFGNVQDWTAVQGGDAKGVRRGRPSTWSERCNLPPLPVERVRIGRQ